jgi:ABC-2 type transport system ATP-binding protein
MTGAMEQRYPMEARIAMRNFSVTYPSFTLKPLSLELKAGERVAIIGPNGSGKTTTLRALAGRLPEYDGSILFDGRDLRGMLPIGRRLIGLLPETLAGYGWMTVREHLAFLREFYPRWDRDYAAHLADRLDVPLGKAIGRLSKGTRVKVSFIAAEAYRPPLLLLDEPTSGLDPEVRGELINAIRSSIDSQPERIVLFSTHLLEDVDLIADRVVLLVNGELGLDASVAQLRESHGATSLAKTLYAALSGPKS